jgi:hypothetical protein
MVLGKVSQARDIKLPLEGAAGGLNTSRLPVALDGEVEIMHPPLQYRSRPEALRVIVPPAARLTKQPRKRATKLQARPLMQNSQTPERTDIQAKSRGACRPRRNRSNMPSTPTRNFGPMLQSPMRGVSTAGALALS